MSGNCGTDKTWYEASWELPTAFKSFTYTPVIDERDDDPFSACSSTISDVSDLHIISPQPTRKREQLDSTKLHNKRRRILALKNSNSATNSIIPNCSVYSCNPTIDNHTHYNNSEIHTLFQDEILFDGKRSSTIISMFPPKKFSSPKYSKVEVREHLELARCKLYIEIAHMIEDYEEEGMVGFDVEKLKRMIEFI